MSNKPRHLLSSADLTAEETVYVLDVAAKLKSRPRQLLEGRQLALVFEKPSLRTRVSFEVAMKHLGGTTLYLPPQEGGLGEREPIKDVARVLARYVDLVAIRTFGQSIVEEYAEFSSIPVINALTNEEHPCQALADLLTVREKLGSNLRGRSIAFIGDGNNVSSSLVITAAALGMDIRMAAPKGHQLPEPVVSEASVRAAKSGGSLALVTRPADAVAGAEVVYTDVWTSMGQEREAARRRVDFDGYQVNRQLMDGAATGAFIMHDLPAHRGDEITDEMMESSHSIVFDQAENRVWAQAAVVALLMGVAGHVQS